VSLSTDYLNSNYDYQCSFIDAERTGAQWLAEWQSSKADTAVYHRIKAKNLVRWKVDSEA